MISNLPASVRARLLNLARERGIPFNEVLTRFGIERLLYRIQCSDHQDTFILKGAMLFLGWTGEMHRPTRDVDFLTSGTPDVERLHRVFRQIVAAPVEPDGLEFDVDSVRAEPIRENNLYLGVRVKLEASLDGARIPLQVDVGFGDSVVPQPIPIRIPPLLEFSPPVLDGYTRYTAVAEKFEAMVTLGEANSRMKDFYDIWTLSKTYEFDGQKLAKSMRSTFSRRNVAMPTGRPLAVSDAFANVPGKKPQWKAFIRRIRATEELIELSDVTQAIEVFLWPVACSARDEADFPKRWSTADAEWQSSPVASEDE